MGGHGKQVRYHQKARGNAAATDGQYGSAASNAAKRALNAAKHAFKVVTQVGHHCPECFGTYNHNTCTKKGHKMMCPVHGCLYYRKSKCVQCVRDGQAEVEAGQNARREQKAFEAAKKAEEEDFFNPLPTRKKPRGQKQ